MAVSHTTISWTDATWSPIRGCSRVSTGCEHCYAERQAGRFSGPAQPYEGLVRKTSQGYRWTGQVRLIDKDLEVPLHWKTRKRIFVNSMSDLFHENVPDAWIDRILGIVWAAQWHTFQCLTKRAERLHAYMAGHPQERIARAAYTFFAQREPAKARLVPLRDFIDDIVEGWPLSKLWLGVSVENQATADARLPWLQQTPAAVRFVSYEPALGPVDFERGGFTFLRPLTSPRGMHYAPLSWVIAGGESGPKARPCNLAWLQRAVQQCRENGVPCWIKQVGARPCVDTTGGARFDDHTFYTVRDPKGSNPAEWPEALRVQQFPEVSYLRERAPDSS